MKDPNNTSDKVDLPLLDSTDPKLIAELREGDELAWRTVATLYGPLVFFWCRRVRMARHDAEDVLQNVFLTVANKVRDYQHDRADASFRGWLWAIARNKIGDWIRRVKKKEASLERADEVRAPELELEEPDELNGSVLLCRQALQLIRGEFQETTWQAFWRVVVQEQDPAEVANELGISRNATYIARSRVLHRLKQVLPLAWDETVTRSEQKPTATDP